MSATHDPVTWDARGEDGRSLDPPSVAGWNRALPVIRIRGAAGPHLLVTAGVHGGEDCGIEGAHAFLAVLPSDRVHGAVTVIPLAIPSAFYAKRQYVVP